MIKEFKLEDINPIGAIETKIWSMFDILRTNGIGLDQSHIVLLLLSLYKDNLISKDFIFNNEFRLENELSEINSESEREKLKLYQSIIPSFASVLISIKDHGFKQIINTIYEIDRKVLSENFPEIFDAFLYRIAQSQGRYGGEFMQPVELTRFISGLADLKKKAKVFNPFAGLASFGLYLDQGQDYFGQELNQKTWALGALRIMAYERPGTSKYVCDDSILHWPAPTEKYDLIIANPPLGMRLGYQYIGVDPSIRTIEHFLLEKGVHSLKAKGKLIALLPQGFLFRGMNEERLREYLVNEDLIDTIISLPGGLLLNTGIQLVIIVLNKDKKTPGKVCFIDAKKFVETKSSREKVLNDYRLNSIIHGNKKDEEAVQIVSNELIRTLGYNLNVPRYFQKKIEGVKLGDILEFIRGKRGNLPKTGKLIGVRDLKEDKVDFKLDVQVVENTKLRRPDIHQIAESCLLLAMRWRTLKPTLFEYKGDPIFRSHDILSFKVNEKIADKAYLISELHADYVKEQVESYRLGESVMSFIRTEDLLEVIVKLPSLEEQRAKVQGIYEISDKIKSLQEEKNSLAHSKSIKQYNEFASLKHTLGRPRQNILGWSKNMIRFFDSQRHEIEKLDSEFKDFYDKGIIEALEEIRSDINFITDVLEKGENGFVLEEYEKQIIPLTEINRIINELSSNVFNFKIRNLLIKGEKLKERGILGNKTLFRTLLDNLLTNANKYGFEKKKAGNEVVIELTEVEEVLIVEVRNNGKHFPKNFDREKFITKYSTANSSSGSGLGGYDIHRIASDFKNPDWELALNDDPFYPVKFKFKFPIKLIN